MLPRARARCCSLLPMVYAVVAHAHPMSTYRAHATHTRTPMSALLSRVPAGARRRSAPLSTALEADVADGATSDAQKRGSDSPTAIVVKVSMVDALRRHLRLPKKARKARFFVDPANEEQTIYEQLRGAVAEHWGWLPEDYTLRQPDATAADAAAAVGAVSVAGSDAAVDAADAADDAGALTVGSTESLEAALEAARARGVAPTLKLSAPLPEPRGPPPCAKVDPAELMAEQPIARMLSFYSFKPIPEPARLKAEVERRLGALPLLGSVYVAEEGVNAQMMVRADMLDALRAEVAAVPELSHVQLNLGDEIRADEVTPFHRFKVTHKGKVLQDGLLAGLDLQEAGEELHASQWHAELASDKPPLLLDCRNWYESEVGRFEGARPLNTNKFHESWPKLEEALRDVDPGQRVLTYCTGGIRCVKINAYLKQKLGFHNVARLEDGIVGYKRWVDEQRAEAERARAAAEAAAAKGAAEQEAPTSLFRGTNFVFDQRVGVKVTDDRLTDDPVLSLIYADDSEEARPLKEAVYHQTRAHEDEEGGGEAAA